MSGYKQLDNQIVELLLEAHLGEVSTISSLEIDHASANNIKYCYYQDKNLIVILSPIPVNDFDDLLPKIKNKILDKVEDKSIHILCGLQGKGITEQHIVTGHVYYESYENNKNNLAPQTNADAAKNSNFFAKIINKIKKKPFYETSSNISNNTNLSTINFSDDSSLASAKQTLTIDIFDPKIGGGKLLSPLHHKKVNYYSLGTQSLFDSISCGYHHVQNIATAKFFIDHDMPITKENLLKYTANPVADIHNAAREIIASTTKKIPVSITLNSDSHVAESDKKNIELNAYQENKLKNWLPEVTFWSFMKKAWWDTMLPLTSDEERSKAKFIHYFLGWPKTDNLVPKVFYFLSLYCIFIPAINLLRRLIELALNIIAESSNYLQNLLIAWAPTNFITQFLRTSLLSLCYMIYGISKGSYYIILPVTSPFISFELAKAIKNPVARFFALVGHAIISGVGLVVLSIVAAPILFAAIVLTLIAIPISFASVYLYNLVTDGEKKPPQNAIVLPIPSNVDNLLLNKHADKNEVVNSTNSLQENDICSPGLQEEQPVNKAIDAEKKEIHFDAKPAVNSCL